MKNITISAFVVFCFISFLPGCGTHEIKPVEIYPEDNCSQCRMAISSRLFASEIITPDDEVKKFDDLACLESFRKKNPAIKIKAIFVTDYDSRAWIPFEKSVIVKTGIDTPMGSGKIAVKDSVRAAAIVKERPPAVDLSARDCCSEQ